MHAVLSLPIASDADIAAALNLYATRTQRWDAGDQAMGEDLAIYIGDAITLAYRRA